MTRTPTAATIGGRRWCGRRSGWWASGTPLAHGRGSATVAKSWAWAVVAAGGRRCRMFCERTTVGLDVHARSVVAEAVDWGTGQVFSRTLTPATEEVLAWVAGLPGPVAATYEAGPTGFGLARALAGAGIRCEVVAPSKLERRPAIGSRPTGGMLDDWPVCCISAN